MVPPNVLQSFWAQYCPQMLWAHSRGSVISLGISAGLPKLAWGKVMNKANYGNAERQAAALALQPRPATSLALASAHVS